MSDASQFQTILSAIVEFRSELMLQIVQVREQLTSQIAQVREELTGQITQVREELVQTRANVMERIDRLQNQVTTMRDDFWLTYTHSDRIEKKVDDEVVLRSHAQQLRLISEELAGVQRQIHHLQNDVRTLRGDA
jgi:uncharacterized coiled-coil DUF342 family protein